MPYTPPDVHRIATGGAGGRQVTLGFVDRDGVYHFPDGRRILANGDAVAPHVGKTGSSAVVRSDGSTTQGGTSVDGAYPEHNAASRKHAVDMLYQAAYDANPDLEPDQVFAAAGGV